MIYFLLSSKGWTFKAPGIVSDQPVLLNFFNAKFICEPFSTLPYHQDMACVLHHTPEGYIKHILCIIALRRSWKTGFKVVNFEQLFIHQFWTKMSQIFNDDV